MLPSLQGLRRFLYKDDRESRFIRKGLRI